MPDSETRSWEMLEDDTGPAPADGPSPGATLRAARESRGLAVGEVAIRLHLQATQIEALEADDHGRFSAPIFVNGYLRNYARLLGVDPEPLIASLRPPEPVEPPPIRSELGTGFPMRRRGVRPELWGGVLIVAVVAGLALLWTFTRGGPAPAVIPDDIAATVESGGFMPQEEPGDFDAGVLERIQAPPDEPALAPPPAEPARLDQVVLRFSGRSWVEITDAAGRRLVVRMGEEGEEMVLQGEAPFDVLLGNAPNVSLEYNGSPYTNFRASRQNVANFRLGRPNEE